MNYTIEPYNFYDYNNGWPDMIGCPAHVLSDLGGTLRSRFALPGAPWSGTSNAELERLLAAGATTGCLGTEYFDPPEGFRFVGEDLYRDPWRYWESSYSLTVMYGPVGWDNYIYRAEGIYVVPTDREIVIDFISIIPLLLPFFLLPPFVVSSIQVLNQSPARRRKKRTPRASPG
jgi:hypothetical protein